jgi:hypothetical protein
MSAAASSSMSSPIYYVPPPPHPVPADYDAFLASLSANERELMEIAKVKLGSSFFVQWCHAYRSWKKAQAKTH